MKCSLFFLLNSCCTLVQTFRPKADGPVLLQVQQSVRLTPLQSLLEASITDTEQAGQPAEEANSSPHPFWVFETRFVKHTEVLTCTLVMLLAGILCSAGGIGGGGVYVTVLMAFGGLSVWDAVPLSKSVVFLGSISSVILNLRKSTKTAAGTKQSLVDFDVCRLVVPSSLFGTYLGVFMNATLPNWLVLCTLLSVLLWISHKILSTTYEQYCEEEVAMSREGPSSESKTSKNDSEHSDRTDQITPTSTDLAFGSAMLLLVVAGSVFRHHAVSCQMADAASAKACHHPTLFWIDGAILHSWMHTPLIAICIQVICLALPSLFCCATTTVVATSLISHGGWSQIETLKFSLMAICTGCLAGFVGVGGGLIFSPFFLIMGMAPAVAVATSTACVIFTSSSTSLQYLFTDRIIISLTLVYGIVNLVASYLGTKIVHNLQDHMSRRRSYISALVSLGVVLSSLLALRQVCKAFLHSHQEIAFMLFGSGPSSELLSIKR